MRRVFGLNDPADRANEMSETLAIFYNLILYHVGCKQHVLVQRT